MIPPIVEDVAKCLAGIGFSQLTLIDAILGLTPNGDLTDLIPLVEAESFPRLLYDVITEDVDLKNDMSIYTLGFTYMQTHSEDLSDVQTIRAQARTMFCKLYKALGEATHIERYYIRSQPLQMNNHLYGAGSNRTVNFNARMVLQGRTGLFDCC